MKSKPKPQTAIFPMILPILLVGGLLVAGGLVSPVVQEAQPPIEWKEVVSAPEGFSIFMPDLPRKKTSSGDSADGTQVVRYDSIFDNQPWYSVLFNLAILRFPESELKDKTPRQMFDSITGPARAKKKWLIMREEAVTTDGYQGVEIELRIPAFSDYGRTKSRARLFIVKDRVYLLQTTYVPKTFLFSRIKTDNIFKFFRSFKITPVTA